MKFANLHLHSVYSDGIFTPEELCVKAKEMGYGALALADHETAIGYDDLVVACKKHGMDCIRGIEMYGPFEGYPLHLTGYDFDMTNPKIVKYHNACREHYYLLTKNKFENMQKQGLVGDLSWDMVLADAPKDAWLCNEQIFASLIKRFGYKQKDYWAWIKTYHSLPVTTTLPSRDYNSAQNLIPMIRDAGGVAVLAHPHEQTHLLDDLYKLGLNGVEYSHPDLDDYDSEQAYAWAKKKGVYLSGGTDHTGELGNNMERGNQPWDADKLMRPYDALVYDGVTEEEFYTLKNRLKG